MKNKIFIIAFSLLLSISAFSNPDEVRKKDLRIVEKIYYLKDSEVPFTGKVSEGKDRLYYLNGKQDGKWISFYKNGNIKSIVNWKDGKLNGKYIIYVYNSNGTYRTKGAYSMGKPIGEWEYYDKDGKLTNKVIAE